MRYRWTHLLHQGVEVVFRARGFEACWNDGPHIRRVWRRSFGNRQPFLLVRRPPAWYAWWKAS